MKLGKKSQCLSKSSKLLVCVLMLIGLAACGQQGALYFPEDVDTKEEMSTSDQSSITQEAQVDAVEPENVQRETSY